MDEVECLQTAMLLIKEHGDQAAAVAAGKVVEFQRAGNGDGMTDWIQVMLTIRELTTEEPNED